MDNARLERVEARVELALAYARRPVADSTILWMPGMPSSGDRVATWAEVMALFGQISGIVEVTVDDTLAPADVSPAAVYELAGRMVFSPRYLNYGQQARVNIPDGALLRNLRSVVGPLFVVGSPMTGPNLEFDPVPGKSSAGCILSQGGMILPLGVVPMMRWTAGTFTLFADDTSGIVGGGSVFARIEAGAAMVLDFDGNSQVPDGWAEGPMGATITYSIDDSIRLPSTPAFLGTVNITLESDASREAYVAASAPNWNNNPPSTVAQALDRLAAHVGPVP